MINVAASSVDDSKPKRYRIESRFRNMNILFLLLLAALLALVVGLVVKDITESASSDYVRFYSGEAMGKFNAYLNRELGLVTKVARSGALINWFADETNPDKKAAAYEEMMSYADMLYSAELYFGINRSLNEYSVKKGAPFTGFAPFDVLDPAKEYDHWYFDCVHSSSDYALNIDIDKVTDQKRLWINHKVMRNGEILGVFCSGLRFSRIVNDLFGKYDSTEVLGFVVDEKGVIQMDSMVAGSDAPPEYGEGRRIQAISLDPAFLSALAAHFEGISAYFSQRDEPRLVKLTTGPYSFASLAPIAGTNWTVVTLFNSKSLFSAAKLTPL
ncbi:MAG: cache domain-containing protein, partial [Planctomycetota bacterium]|nr:cache domain-containing protein [Planctomycetota bacterium]